MRYDVVIIGGGLSGLTCGIRLQEAGKNCAIISAGQSALHFSSGAFDFLNKLPDGTRVMHPLDAIKRLGGNHPYRKIGEEKIREYVWFMETRAPYAPATRENPYYLGTCNDTGYYFYYEPEQVTVLDYPFLSTITEKSGSTVIYADRCSIGADKLAQMGIVFKKIPRDISSL